MEWLGNPNAWIGLLTLTVLEIVLGIDNIIFISILADRLPREQQTRARLIGLTLALVLRIGLLFGITWIMSLIRPLFSVAGQALSGRDLILGIGGLFLIAKSTHEIYSKLEVEDDDDAARTAGRRSMALIIVQILLLDIVFSLDSVITAVGMADDIPVMIIAIVIAIAVMLVASGPLSRFVEQHPTVKMLALSFLLLIGMSLVADGFEVHIPKGYIYFAMGFSVFVELLNLRLRPKTKPLHLRPSLEDPEG
jgi:predicted tellurium resistance membrane protein TerC